MYFGDCVLLFDFVGDDCLVIVFDFYCVGGYVFEVWFGLSVVYEG